MAVKTKPITITIPKGLNTDVETLVSEYNLHSDKDHKISKSQFICDAITFYIVMLTQAKNKTKEEA